MREKMGFLNNLLKTVSQVKDIADEVQSVMKESGLTEKAEDRPAQERIVTLAMPQGIQAREFAQGMFYDNDADGNECMIKTKMMIEKRFHVFDSGAGEVDVSFAYSPEIAGDEEYADWDSATPCLMIGYEDAQAELLNKYLRTKEVPAGATVAHVRGKENVLYKTTSNQNQIHYVTYHFHRGFDRKMLYQMEVFYPVSYVGTPIEKVFKDALDAMVMSYTEIK